MYELEEVSFYAWKCWLIVSVEQRALWERAATIDKRKLPVFILSCCGIAADENELKGFLVKPNPFNIIIFDGSPRSRIKLTMRDTVCKKIKESADTKGLSVAEYISKCVTNLSKSVIKLYGRAPDRRRFLEE